jgi:hypothetical protein
MLVPETDGVHDFMHGNLVVKTAATERHLLSAACAADLRVTPVEQKYT